MSVGGVSGGSPDISQLTASMTELTQQYAVMQRLSHLDNPWFQDQVSTFARYAKSIGQQISALTAEIHALTAPPQPKLSPPKPLSPAEVGTNVAAMKSNGWLNPNSLVAFISAMQYVLNQQALNTLVEGQNLANTMKQQQRLSESQAEAQREQGQQELEKGWISASIEVVGAGVMFATVAKRVSVMTKGSGTAKTQQMEKEAETQMTENTRLINLKNQENARLKAEADGNPDPGAVKIGSSPIGAKKPLDPNSIRAKEINHKIDQNNQEVAELQNRNIKIKENLEYQKQDILRQELVTWEQVGRGIDHFSNAAMKLTEGIFNKRIKDLDAEITLIQTQVDILKTYSQSVSKQQSSSEQNAQEAVRAMDSFFQAHSQAFWAVAA